MKCDVCNNTLAPSKEIALLNCKQHFGCSVVCCQKPCIKCRCDKCEGLFENTGTEMTKETMVCECEYHAGCVPNENRLYQWGCEWCEPVNKGQEVIRKANDQNKPSRFFNRGKDGGGGANNNSNNNNNNSQPEGFCVSYQKIIRRNWKFKDLESRKFYRGKYVIQAQIPYSEWRRHDMDIAAFKALDVVAFDLLGAYFGEMQKSDFPELLSVYDNLSFPEFITGCGTYFKDTKGKSVIARTTEAWKAKDITVPFLMKLGPTRDILEDYGNTNCWNKYYPELLTAVSKGL